MHFVTVHQTAPPPSARGEPVRKHRDDGVEVRAGQIPVRPGPSDHREQIVHAQTDCAGELPGLPETPETSAPPIPCGA